MWPFFTLLVDLREKERERAGEREGGLVSPFEGVRFHLNRKSSCINSYLCGQITPYLCSAVCSCVVCSCIKFVVVLHV